METENPIFPRRLRTVCLAVSLLGAPIGLLMAQGGSGTAAQEQARRFAAVEEASELLRKGDESYEAGRYSDAVEAYGGARELIPDAPHSRELRVAATDRYAQASVEYARQLSRKGDVAGAKAAVDRVLREDVAPSDPGALTFRGQLDDPIRTNPALTAEHARDVDAVRRALYTAEGAFNLGKYDEAKVKFEEVLGLDPTNSAARRGLERVAAAKSGHYQSAMDHTRAEMLAQVDAAWETPITAPDLGAEFTDPGLSDIYQGSTVAAKLDRIVIPKVGLDQANLDEALDFLRVKAAENDTMESDPAKKGVNFTVNLGPANSEVANRIRGLRFDLQLSQVPLSRVLKYVMDMTQTSYTTDDFSVIIRPLGSTSAELVTRTYQVPADFLTNLSAGSETQADDDDPFGEAPAGGLLTRRLSARDALAKQGVAFPEGASANHNSSTNTLLVVNTASNHDIISQIIDAMTLTEPVIVSVKVTMLKVQREDLEELGFDWLLTPINLNSSDTLFGSGGTIGNTPGRGPGDFLAPVPGLPTNPDALVGNGVVTNGLRSGDQGIDGNSIDDLINNQNRDPQTSAVAPGILAVTGLFTDGQAQVVMRGLSQKKGIDMMARPAVHARSGQQSKITIIQDFFYPSEYEPPELPNQVGDGGGAPVTPATPTAFDSREVGITLEVLPVADANKRFVDITLNPSITELDGFVNYGSPINSSSQGLQGTQTFELTPNRILMPVFSVQRASTQLSIADGATVALGGLISHRVQSVDDSVPVLGSLPLLGRLFQSTARKPVSTSVIFLVRVELLDPTGRPYRDR
jgi:general secretion pathway protein D